MPTFLSLLLTSSMGLVQVMVVSGSQSSSAQGNSSSASGASLRPEKSLQKAASRSVAPLRASTSPTSSWKLWLWNSGLRLRRRVDACTAVGWSGGRLARTNTPPRLRGAPEMPSTVRESRPEEGEKSMVKCSSGAGLELGGLDPQVKAALEPASALEVELDP